MNASTDEHFFETLTKLGLTILEAKIYLSLCHQEALTAKELSMVTRTSQPDTYRVLCRLQRKGLIEKIIGYPSQFKAVPLETGLASLLKRKKVEYDNLTQETNTIVRSFKEKISSRKHSEIMNSYFTLIPKEKIIVKRIGEAIKRSKRSVDIILSWKRLIAGITGPFALLSRRAWNRGVEFRIVVEQPEDEKAVAQALQFCGESSSCNIKFLSGKTETVIGIYDKKESFIIVDPEQGLFDSPALWSNNQSLIRVLQEYFNTLWFNAIEK